MIEKIRYKDHEDWLNLRKSGIGGSEAGIVMGISEYGSPLTVWSDKMGIGKPVEANLAMKMGNYLEPLVAAEFMERTGKKVQERHYMMKNTKYPWAIANIDRKIVGENAILECKTTGSIPRIRAFRQGEYPDEWYCQVQHYMAVGGFERAYLACIARNMQGEYMDWVIPRDDEFIKVLMEKEEALWDRVMQQIPPDPNGNDREKDVLFELFNAKEELSIDITGSMDLVEQYKDYAKLEKQYKQMKDAAKNAICMAMGDAVVGLSNGEKVCSWKVQTRKEHVVGESTSRVFRLNV